MKITMGLKKVGWEGMDWVHLTQDGDKSRALENTSLNFLFP
jgi:hypothetical protein